VAAEPEIEAVAAEPRQRRWRLGRDRGDGRGGSERQRRWPWRLGRGGDGSAETEAVAAGEGPTEALPGELRPRGGGGTSGHGTDDADGCRDTQHGEAQGQRRLTEAEPAAEQKQCRPSQRENSDG
jgi:hypothetical protein